ncbi:hypothetical protein L228DRAFT_252532 [Xylona heveae TC161]|uniref:ribonuclease Z n=1 Tax=Xylona heveae (strain CBS 132557 / TC161) TaxID=1328760 RepID=A0A165HW74_XYLHT|nr:hypothetical protein L228DRAFT_252532 [Xylona heveae TC161]KZF24011.1 hypothetical protein L228DRAFT_252532 [Xylona heveae TC161]
MRNYVQFITTPTGDTPGTTVMIHFDSKRYLFGNVSEGTQRACTQTGARLAKVSDIFVTGKTEWATVGGAIGMILTLADVTGAAAADAAEKQKGKVARKGIDGEHTTSSDLKPTLNIHGSSNLLHTLATARKFVFRKGMPVNVEEYYDDRTPRYSGTDIPPSWADSNLNVWAMPVCPAGVNPKGWASGDKSPGKRTFDEMDESEEDLAAKFDRDNQMRKSIVGEMFNSSWRLDAMEETHISQVDMPATLFVRNRSTRQIEKYEGPMPGGPEPLPDIKVLVRKPWPGAMISKLPSTSPSPVAMSWIVRNHPQRGKFQPAKAKQLNVKNPRQFGELASGKSVIADDGKTVTPDMVLSPGKQGGGMAIVELPSADYVAPLLERREWKSKEVMDGIEAIIWILGPGVIGDQLLNKFVTENKQFKHIVSSRDVCPNYLSMDSAAAATVRLSQLDSDRFPLLVHDNRTLPQPGYGLKDFVLPSNSPFIAADRGLKVQLEPSVEVQQDALVPFVNTGRVIRETDPEVIRLADQAKKEISSDVFRSELEQKQRDIPSKDAEIITLGTGSALPSKYRNVSATLLRVPGYGSYLLDCGENTLGQLRRVFPPEELREVLHDLRAIWISHLHADHHLGAASVIKAWYKTVYGDNPPQNTPLHDADLLARLEDSLTEKRLFIFSDKGFIQWLREYSMAEDIGYSKLMPVTVKWVQASKTTEFYIGDSREAQILSENEELNAKFAAATGLQSFQAPDVNHCRGAKALVLSFPNGFKFSYSGDARPSKSFAEAGKGSTVLLHEATFDDELQSDAKAKKHSTTSEALAVGLEMGARRIMLTHFSQRYQKIPNMDALDGKLPALEEDADAPPPAADAADEDKGGQIRRGTHQTKEHSTASPSIPPAEAIDRAKRGDVKIGVAFDYMRVKVGEIAHLEKFTPAFLKLYEEKEAEESIAPGDELEPDEKQKKIQEKQEKKKTKGQKHDQKNKPKVSKEKNKKDVRQEHQPAGGEPMQL